jgi:hypothetical protein
MVAPIAVSPVPGPVDVVAEVVTAAAAVVDVFVVIAEVVWPFPGLADGLIMPLGRWSVGG